MKLKILITLASFVITLSACRSADLSDTRDVQNDSPGGKPPATLDGTSWSLTQYGNTTLPEGITVTAQFEDGRVYGSSGCNTYRGTYQLDRDHITFGPLAATRMACLEPEGIMEIEGTFLEWMSASKTFEVAPGQLTLSRSDGDALTFSPEP